MTAAEPVIILVPFPAQGHITPMHNLGVALRRHHGFLPVLVLPVSLHRRLAPPPTAGGGQEAVVVASVPDGVASGGGPGDFFSIERAMEDVMPPHLEALLRRFDGGRGDGRRGRVACVVVDLLASWAMVVAARCNVPVAGFWPAMLATYRLISAAPDMVRRGLISAAGIPTREAALSDAFPWCEPALSTADLPWLVGDLDSQRARFAFWMRTLDRSRDLRWLAVNTFPGEGCRRRSDAALPRLRRLSPPCGTSAPAGPRVFQVAGQGAAGGSCGDLGLSFWEEDRSCVRWLEEQLPGSVVYVSFGSWVGPVGDGFVAELALGLEATGRPYLWVLGDAWRSGLPLGFLGRRRGKVVAWAPQREVLRHAAVGCYLTHCGWNSTMEALQCRKRLLCHPVAGDQLINCRYIVEVWGVGVRLPGMRREAVREGVERVMSVAEGGELQRRVTEMGVKLRGEEEGQPTAAAELSAFAEEVNAGMDWRGGGEWPPPQPQMSLL